MGDSRPITRAIRLLHESYSILHKRLSASLAHDRDVLAGYKVRRLVLHKRMSERHFTLRHILLVHGAHEVMVMIFGREASN